jgi:hypothetical protein
MMACTISPEAGDHFRVGCGRGKLRRIEHVGLGHQHHGAVVAALGVG